MAQAAGFLTKYSERIRHEVEVRTLVSGGQVLFLAGQDASDENGRIVSAGDVVAQFEQVLQNLQAVVHAAGGTTSDIVKLNIFVKDRHDYRARLKELGQVHRRYFGSYYPTMSLFEVTGFFQADALIELEGIAVIGWYIFIHCSLAPC